MLARVGRARPGRPPRCPLRPPLRRRFPIPVAALALGGCASPAGSALEGEWVIGAARSATAWLVPDSSCSYAGSGATMLLGARLQGTVHTWYSFCGPNGSADYEIRASVTGTRRYRLVVPADAETGFPTYFPAETSEGRLADCELSEDGEELGCTTAGGSTHTWRRS